MADLKDDKGERLPENRKQRVVQNLQFEFEADLRQLRHKIVCEFVQTLDEKGIIWRCVVGDSQERGVYGCRFLECFSTHV